MLIPLLLVSQFVLADSLYSNHHFDVAYIEYERAFFFHPELESNPQKRVKYAISLFHSDQYKGIKAFHSIFNDLPDLDPEFKAEMAMCYLDSGYFYEASELLVQTNEKKLLGFTYLLDNRPYSAREVFISIEDKVIVDQINSYLNKPKKALRTAALLSIICPGAGEIYGGNTKLGIQDFLLNLGSGYLIYNAVKQKKYIDAVLVFSLLFNRFYVGSIYNAQISAAKTNEKSRQMWLDQMKRMCFNDLDQKTLNR
ncbi:MAG: hypothetical protein WBB37_12230 [bacterium]